MDKPSLDMRAVVVHNFITKEYGAEHHKLTDETRYGRLLQDGNPDAVDSMLQALISSQEGTLSKDPLTNIKYFFITAVTITIRFCIAGGMDEQEAYYTSDLFIQSLDGCESRDSVLTLAQDMVSYYVKKMAALHNTAHCSRAVYSCINYIYEHLHEKLSAHVLAEYVQLSPDYLEKLFKKELGLSITDFITAQKMDTARKMLLFSEFNCSEIAFYLGYSSQSYFTKTFREYYKITPTNYKKHAHQLPFSETET